ncbi:hypothetical protein SAMN06265337_1635 [Hymenobacter gelipurpurascens]|uniref:Uncharacterized protein n=1 Tax=Hymenobacter gelipurpurascens TaxID=89968 RepID=A0A212TKZ2_9BACT|nr:DUF6544 family protein [Hymenobacter gelipurpurascens]SNC66511.1 hypothetical protein SAMN06265337_1635 [Hymenobacter gelipurpurascens]
MLPHPRFPRLIPLLASVGLATAAGLWWSRYQAHRQLRRKVAQLFAQAEPSPEVYVEARLAGLPAPVQRYFRHVLREGQPYLSGLRLRHTGQFKTDLKKDWLSIEGEQYSTANPPGFIWQGTTRLFTAQDEYLDGHGRLAVRLLGAIPLMQGEGIRYDQGELLRWLGECVWLPTALLPAPHLRWTAAPDDHSAHLTLTHHGQTVSYLVRFNEQDGMVQCETQRYQGDTTLLPWVGRFSRYRVLHGVRVPTRLEASWVVDGQRLPYARFRVLELAYHELHLF